MKSNLPPTTHAERLAAVQEWQQTMLEKFGFYIHFVFDGAPDGLVNIHTHGFDQSWGCPDIQITINIGQKAAMGILHDLASRCRQAHAEGQPCPLVVGKVYGDIAFNYDTAFIEATEGERKVLRLIVPDKNNELDPTKLEGVFAAQYKHLDL